MSSIPPPETAPADPTSAPASPPSDLPPWRIWMAPAAVVLGFALGLVGTVLVGIVAQVAGSSLTHPTPAVSLVENLIFDLGFVAAAVYFAATSGRLSPADFGFRRVSPRLAIGGFVTAGVVYYVNGPGIKRLVRDFMFYMDSPYHFNQSGVYRDQGMLRALAAKHDLEGGIRSVEIGRLMFADSAKWDLVRLAIPRRVYTQSHIDYVIEVILEVWERRSQVKGLKLRSEAPFLRHFTAHLEPLEAVSA